VRFAPAPDDDGPFSPSATMGILSLSFLTRESPPFLGDEKSGALLSPAGEFRGEKRGDFWREKGPPLRISGCSNDDFSSLWASCPFLSPSIKTTAFSASTLLFLFTGSRSKISPLFFFPSSPQARGLKATPLSPLTTGEARVIPPGGVIWCRNLPYPRHSPFFFSSYATDRAPSAVEKRVGCPPFLIRRRRERFA